MGNESYTEYVVGLLFSEDGHRLVLIRKNRPAWQAARLNGPGGKVRRDEGFRDAMRREFLEEAGVDLESWEEAVDLNGTDFRCRFFRAFSNAAVLAVTTMTDEPLVVVRTAHVLGRSDLIPNLNWIIPLCADPCASLPLEVQDRPSSGRPWTKGEV